MANGIVLIPADRAADAVVGELSLAENLSLPTIDRFYVRGWMRGGRLMRACTDLLDRFRVKPRDPNAAMSALSGGNQQRALLAKWLQLKPRLLLLHEPTQGVDVAARQDIFRLLRAAAEDGMTVICASSDYEQLGLLADRVLIFRAGHPVDELRGDDVTKDHITEACLAAPSADPVAEGSG